VSQYDFGRFVFVSDILQILYFKTTCIYYLNSIMSNHRRLTLFQTNFVFMIIKEYTYITL